MSPIPTLYLGGHRARRMLGALQVLNRFVNGGVEGKPDARYPIDAELCERIGELTNDHPDTVRDGLNVRGLFGVGHRSLQVIEYRQELAQDVVPRLLFGVRLIASRPLAVVVEIRRRPEKLVFEASGFLLGLLERIDRGFRSRSWLGADLSLGGGVAVRSFGVHDGPVL